MHTSMLAAVVICVFKHMNRYAQRTASDYTRCYFNAHIDTTFTSLFFVCLLSFIPHGRGKKVRSNRCISADSTHAKHTACSVNAQALQCTFLYTCLCTGVDCSYDLWLAQPDTVLDITLFFLLPNSQWGRRVCKQRMLTCLDCTDNVYSE
jgi:hypothetical protein